MVHDTQNYWTKSENPVIVTLRGLLTLTVYITAREGEDVERAAIKAQRKTSCPFTPSWTTSADTSCLGNKGAMSATCTHVLSIQSVSQMTSFVISGP
jgi:hypothetical protein